MTRGWIGVDLDGTLAMHHGKQSKRIGEPIPAMVERVKMWLKEGHEVRIVTARASRISFHIFPNRDEKTQIERWCLEHIGEVLQIQAHKDYFMIELWDDRAVQVQMNTGKQVGASRLDVRLNAVETTAGHIRPVLEVI
jgi:Cys-tRNA synthase (O-phospho-L-seryl-tRNA:Cys-tRNA synthase)